jgi:flagella synthesis protein FlgN
MTQLLLHCLTREHTAVGEFLDVLDREAEAMTQGQFSSLPALTERKSQLADQIALLGRQRESAQVSQGYTADRQGTDAIVAAGGPALQQAWDGLRARAAQAHERNHRNGVMIHTHLDFTRQTIGFLQSRGKPLYGPDGAHHAGSGSGNSLAQG